MGRLAPRVAGFGGTLSLALSVASVASVALAQEPPPEQPVRVTYDAPAGCPDEVAFFLHVRARTQRVRAASADELATAVAVHITNEASGSVGILEMPGADGKPFARRVEATTCGEVELALSLVLALAYDPDAITTFPEPAAATPPPAPAPPPPAPPPAPPPEVPSTPPPVELAFGGAVLARSGIAPSIAPLFGAFVEYGAKPVTGFSPTFQAALFFSPSLEASTGSGVDRRSASLQYFGGRLLGCPLSLVFGEDFSADPCLTFDAGRIFGVAGEDVESGHAGGLTWLSIGAEARIRWKLVRPLFVEVAGGGGLTFFHEKFLLKGPEAELFAIPAAFGEVGGAVGIHFP